MPTGVPYFWRGVDGSRIVSMCISSSDVVFDANFVAVADDGPSLREVCDTSDVKDAFIRLGERFMVAANGI